MQIKDMQMGRTLEIQVDREGFQYRFVSKVEGTAVNSVAVSAIEAKGKIFHFADTDDITIIYRGTERMWRWDHVKGGMARLDGDTVHTFSSNKEGMVYNRRESFRVSIGESLLMRRVIQETDEQGMVLETEKSFDALLSDLSINGAGLFTNEPLEIGTPILFDMPTNLGVLSCRGEIVREAKVVDKPFAHFYGCDFSVIKKELERYLFERQRLMLQRERGRENVRIKNK